MEQFLLPTKIEFHPGDEPNKAKLSVEPLFPGYGLTIGTAIRRVLLSSLEGGAVVAVKIKGVEHEFSTLPYVKEDVVDIILNLKKLRFNVHTDESVRVILKAKGEKEVTGADIETTSDVEVASKDALICTLTDKNSQLEMELIVRKGRGFVPTEVREKEKLELGTIMVDSLFTPIRNVGMHIEDMRVGQHTNYNRVTLDIETDGTITAQDAVAESSKILIDHFQAILNSSLEAAGKPLISEATSAKKGEEGAEEVVIDDQAEDAYVENEEAAEADSDEDDSAKKKRGRPRKND